MICVSLAETTAEKCFDALRGIDFAEIRLDKMQVEIEDVKKIFSHHPKLIATCRPGKMNDEIRIMLILTAIEAGAAFVDVEVESDAQYKNAILEKARSSGCRLIVSYHNFEKTPQKTKLEQIISQCFESGADVAKIACMIHSEKDNARLLGLLNEERPLVVVGLGKKGKISRIAAPFLGNAFTYASLSKGKETAKGQMDWKTLKQIIQVLKNV